MPRRPLAVILVLTALVVLSGTVFQAQTAQRTLTFAELTYGSRVTTMTSDRVGGAWFAGWTCSSELPTTPDALQPDLRRDCDAFLGRTDAAGALVYLSYFGPAWIHALTTDAAGNLFIAGYTASPDFPTTSNAYDRTCGTDGSCMTWKRVAGRDHFMAARDGFVTKLTPGGDRILYSTYIGGAHDDQVTAIAVDATGRIHVGGDTTSFDFPATPGALQSNFVWSSDPNGDSLPDAFYARLSTDGSTLAYSTYLGGAGTEVTAGIALDAAGDAYIAGSTNSREFPTLNAARPHNTSPRFPPYVDSDGWLARFGGSGAVYSTYVGGTDGDSLGAIGVVGTTVYLGGSTCSTDFPGTTTVECGSAFVSEVSAAHGAVTRTVLLHRGGFNAIAGMSIDANHVAYVAGNTTSPTFPTTPDAFQRTHGGDVDAFVSIVPMGPTGSGIPVYSSYLGGANEEHTWAMTSDGNGGLFFGGYSRLLHGHAGFPSRTTQPQPPPETDASNEYQSFIAHVSLAEAPSSGGAADIVLYARDAGASAGNWQPVTDSSAGGGTRLWNPDAGVPKIGTAAAAPASFFELTFHAEAGVPYHLWLRMKADNDSWTNDSVFVQFSDTVDGVGNPIWRTGTTSAAMVSLEDCSGCGERGWGWNDNGYDAPALPVTFATTGTHTIRIQQREDGISIDQIVLSRQTYFNDAPGTPKDDTTILAQSDGGSSEPPPPPPPPPSDPREIVMYVAGERLPDGQNWILTSDESAAGGARLVNPDAGQPKLASPSASGSDYFEVQFTAEAGVAYHLWIRSQALNDHWTNDSVFVQFSDSVDAGGNPTWRIGSDSATSVSLEDCSGCGEQGWGWNDNAYGGLAAPISFATSGPQTIRVLRREDGISIDQIVLSAGRYLDAAPGVAKNDTTIVAK